MRRPRTRDFVFEIIIWSLSNKLKYWLPGDLFELYERCGVVDFEVLNITARANPDDPRSVHMVHRLRVPRNSNSVDAIAGNEVKVRLLAGIEVEGQILAESKGYWDVEVTVETKAVGRWRLIESHAVERIWNECQNCMAGGGLFMVEGEVPDALRLSLQNGIEQLAQKELPDYHPNTGGVVRDYVHPSLYPYVKGVSNVTGTTSGDVLFSFRGNSSGKDAWGRPYEDSIYQWLPAHFFVDEWGKCSIKSYINNLPQDKYPQLYTNLESLFDIFLPWFERVCNRMETLTPDFDQKCSLRNRELQVIVKIVDYELAPGKSFEGVWHVEGMSHENIVATGLYVIQRDECIQGGDLLFKRPFNSLDISEMEREMPPFRHMKVQEILDNGLVPNGKFSTQEGVLIVFPNSHVHKVDLMYNAGTEFGRRRIIVFFLVNPFVHIVSTRYVEPQQGVISRQDAMEHRLQLMKERKRHKQTWNIRQIELCEH